MSTATKDGDAQLPPMPAPPEAGECCGRGCERCVWVYYEEALERWRRRIAEITRDGVP